MRTLIGDHEPHARATLRHVCEADDGCDEVAVAVAARGVHPANPATANNKRRRWPSRLTAESSQRLYFLAVEDVDYIESCGNYVLIHVGDQKYLRRDTVKRLAAELREAGFEWIRRSTLINLARVAFAEKIGHGALAFTLTCGTRLVSKTRVKLVGTRAEEYDGDEP